MGGRKQVNIHYHDFEGENGHTEPSEHELQVRLVELELLNDKDCEDLNSMFIDWLEKGKIYWTPEMSDLDLMIQFRLVTSGEHKKYVGSISFPLKDIFTLSGNFKQWFTIFDTLDDDIFDGYLGVDDEEKPRIYVGFEIKDYVEGMDESHQSSVNELSMTKSDKEKHRVGTVSEPRINIEGLDFDNDDLLRSSGGKISSKNDIRKRSTDDSPAKKYNSNERKSKKSDSKESNNIKLHSQKSPREMVGKVSKSIDHEKSSGNHTPPTKQDNPRKSSDKKLAHQNQFETPPKQSPLKPTSRRSNSGSPAPPKDKIPPKTSKTNHQQFVEKLEVKLNEKCLEIEK